MILNENGEIREDDSMAMNGSGGMDMGAEGSEVGHGDSGSEYESSDRGEDESDVRSDNDDSDDEVPNGKYLSQPLNFWARRNFRPLYMCPAERRLAGQLTDLIEQRDRRLGGLTFVDSVA